jgi:tRNA pseudouridine55 synthase
MEKSNQKSPQPPVDKIISAKEEAPRAAARPILVKRFELLRTDLPDFEVEIECGSGTYIRTLLDDLGSILGTGATMQELERTSQGTFTIESALTLEQITASELEPLMETLFPHQ